jgi:flavin reductase (DIM6/NTAB) family NADH-FMN oxidoreductase RutF
MPADVRVGRPQGMSAAVTTPDAKAFRAALSRFATGVTLVTTQAPDGRPIGLTVSSFNSVSLTPPLVLWSLSLGSSTQSWFDTATDYAINVLAADQIELARQFSTRALANRFDGVEWTPGLGGAPVITGCAAVFECRSHARYPAGDHTIHVGEVLRCEHREVPPLVFHAGGFDLTPK